MDAWACSNSMLSCDHQCSAELCRSRPHEHRGCTHSKCYMYVKRDASVHHSGTIFPATPHMYSIANSRRWHQLRRTIPYHTIPYHTVPYHTTPYHTIPYHTIPYHTIPYIAKPYIVGFTKTHAKTGVRDYTTPHHTILVIVSITKTHAKTGVRVLMHHAAAVGQEQSAH